jgi:hypothetical protein
MGFLDVMAEFFGGRVHTSPHPPPLSEPDNSTNNASHGVSIPGSEPSKIPIISSAISSHSGQSNSDASELDKSNSKGRIMTSEIQALIDKASPGEKVELPYGKGEVMGPIRIDKSLILVGNGCYVHSLRGPVVEIAASNVHIENFTIEVADSRYPDDIDGDDACAVWVHPGCSASFQNIVLVGNVVGIPAEVGIWRYPKILNLGAIKAQCTNIFKIVCDFPIECKIQPENGLRGIHVFPNIINFSGITEIDITIDPLTAGTVLRGWIEIATPLFMRKIRISANIAERVDSKSVVGTGQILYTAPAPKLMPQVPPPVFLPGPGVHEEPLNLTIICNISGATIHYTQDGSEPTEQSPIYSTPLSIAKNVDIKAQAFCSKMIPSTTTHGIFEIKPKRRVVAPPVFNPPPGAYEAPLSVDISCTTDGAVIRYTEDGSEPSSKSRKYSSPFQIKCKSGVELRARAFKKGMDESVVVNAKYTVNDPIPIEAKRASKPTICPTGGAWMVYSEPVTVSIQTQESSIRYTLDGSDPTEFSALYVGPFEIKQTTIVKARSFSNYLSPSHIVEARYQVKEFTKIPVQNPEPTNKKLVDARIGGAFQ